MARIEWTRLEGGDVEAVVAMLIAREHPASIRITPSRGDGGVDILHRRAAKDGGDVVYQVKRFASPLTSAQKDSVSESLASLKTDPRWAHLSVSEWKLTMPWDPTPEAITWLDEITKDGDFDAGWHGLAFIEGLAAKYPDVIDYYLHGGRERIVETFEQVQALFSLGQAAPAVPDLISRTQTAMKLLEADPHYRYEIELGEDPLPEAFLPRPWRVMTWVSSEGGHWAAVHIVARTAVSSVERPITFTGHISIEPGSAFEEEFRGFVDFGAPFSSPDGSWTGAVDAPGGLGGSIANGSIAALSDPREPGAKPVLRVEALSAEHQLIATVALKVVDRSAGQRGQRVLLEEEHGVFTLEDRVDLAAGTFSRNIRLGSLTGLPVLQAEEALNFLHSARRPNWVRVSRTGTPATLGSREDAYLLEEGAEDDLSRLVKMLLVPVDALSRLQQHSRSVLTVPDLVGLKGEVIREWSGVAALLEGETLVTRIPEGQALFVTLSSELRDPPETLSIEMPLTVSIGEREEQFGSKILELRGAKGLRIIPRDGSFLHEFELPDLTLRWRRAEHVG